MGMLLEQIQLGRGGGLGAVEGTQRFTRGLQAVGAIKGQDISLLSEYLPLLVNLQKEQVKIAGETNNEIATNLVAGIMSLDESFKNPDVLRGVLPSLMGGLRQASSPQVEALQFRALSMMPGNRGKSLLELEIQRESPTLGYLEAQLAQLSGVSVNEDAFTRNIFGEFKGSGMSLALAQKMAKGYGKTGFNVGDYSGEMGIKNIKTGAIGSTSMLDRASAEFTQNFEKYGNALTTSIDSFINENLPEEIKDLSEVISNLIDLIKKINSASEDATGMGVGGVYMKYMSFMMKIANPGGTIYKAFQEFNK